MMMRVGVITILFHILWFIESIITVPLFYMGKGDNQLIERTMDRLLVWAEEGESCQ